MAIPHWLLVLQSVSVDIEAVKESSLRLLGLPRQPEDLIPSVVKALQMRTQVGSQHHARHASVALSSEFNARLEVTLIVTQQTQVGPTEFNRRLQSTHLNHRAACLGSKRASA